MDGWSMELGIAWFLCHYSPKYLGFHNFNNNKFKILVVFALKICNQKIEKDKITLKKNSILASSRKIKQKCKDNKKKLENSK